MKHLIIAALLGSLSAGPAHTQSGFWRDSTGKPLPETESMKSAKDFAGSLLATPDEDWEKKWNTPPEVKPNFNKADVVPHGKKIFILTFFANPKLDQSGNANVRCDLMIVGPTGKTALAQKNVTCFAGQFKGHPYDLYLAAPVITFSTDPGDPSGTWVVQVTLRDAVRGVELPLRTTFSLR